MSHASQPDPRDPTLPREHAGASATQSSTQELLALLQRTIFPAQAVTVAQKMLQVCTLYRDQCCHNIEQAHAWHVRTHVLSVELHVHQ